MVWNLFKRKKSAEDEDKKENQELENRINQALEKAEADKRAVLSTIKKLEGHAASAIIDIYADFFPNANLTYYREKYKQDALEKYDEIKKEHASKLDPKMAKECDKIVEGYLNQIELMNSKKKLYDKLYTEYLMTKKKYQAARDRAEKMERLGKHGDRLEEMNDDVNYLADSYKDNYELDDISKEVELREEYFKQLENLKQTYGDDDNLDNALAYKKEVDGMINKL